MSGIFIKLLCPTMVLLVGLSTPATAVDRLDLEVRPAESNPVPGQPFTLQVRGVWPAAWQAKQPPWPALLGGLTLVDSEDRSRTEGDQLDFDLRLQVKAAKPDLYVVGPVTIDLAADGVVVARASAARQFLEIPAGAAAQADLRGNKPLQAIRHNLQWLWWLVGALALIVVGVLLWIWLQRRRQEPPIDPYAEWLSGFSNLRQAHDPDTLLGKDAAYGVSFVVRQYLERRSGVDALEMTGKELQRALAPLPDMGGQREHWLALARTCVELETIKYREGGQSDRSFATWTAPISRSVDDAEAAHTLAEAGGEAQS